MISDGELTTRYTKEDTKVTNLYVIFVSSFVYLVVKTAYRLLYFCGNNAIAIAPITASVINDANPVR
jgi:hypothetical protein